MAKENVMQQYLKDFVSRKKENIEAALCVHKENKISLCKLKNISFLPDYEPDYSDSLLRNVYLLRYGVAYFTEYYRLYEKIFSAILPGYNSYSLFSVGCGAHIDKVAAQFALNNFQQSSRLHYVGLDRVDWGDEVESTAAQPCTILCIDSLPIRLEADILAFPKSISELDELFLDNFASRVFTNKFILSVSLRKGETVSFDDISKVECLLHNFSVRGYHVKYKETLTLDGTTIFNNLRAHPFASQSDAFTLVNNLDSYCYCRETCTNQCASSINKNPMTSLKYFHDDLYLLEKNDATSSAIDSAPLG